MSNASSKGLKGVVEDAKGRIKQAIGERGGADRRDEDRDRQAGTSSDAAERESEAARVQAEADAARETAKRETEAARARAEAEVREARRAGHEGR